MDFETIRRAALATPRRELPAVRQLAYQAQQSGRISWPEVEEIEELLTRRWEGADTVEKNRSRAGSRPRTAESLRRRRELSMSGELPQRIRAQLTPGQASALVVVGREVKREGECKLCVDHIAALAGVSKTVAKEGIRIARDLGLIAVEHRTVGHRRNDSNIIRIVDGEWLAWLKLGRAQKATAGLGVIRAATQGGFAPPTSDRRITRRGEGSRTPLAFGLPSLGEAMRS